MDQLWIFRSNIRKAESYSKFQTIEEFKKECWDFYLLQGIWYLENKKFDQVIIWRLTEKPKNDIIFDISGKLFIQKFVKNFRECFKYPKPLVSFFRGGFREYDEITKLNPKHFGMKLYLGAAWRVFPQYGGTYNKFLVENNDELNNKYCIPFYKTSNPQIFFSINYDKEYDLCWPVNFTQIKQKGQEFFIKQISNSSYLQSLKILHVGNKPNILRKLCKKYRVKNIETLGHTTRQELNKAINKCRFGIVTSNKIDGCPRISTEILNTKTPLIIRDQTRLLDYYKSHGVVVFNDHDISKKIKKAFNKYDKLNNDINKLNLSLKKICLINLKSWSRTV